MKKEKEVLLIACTNCAAVYEESLKECPYCHQQLKDSG